MKDHAASVVGLGGLVAVVIGAAAVASAAGWIVGGLAALWVASRLSQ